MVVIYFPKKNSIIDVREVLNTPVFFNFLGIYTFSQLISLNQKYVSLNVLFYTTFSLSSFTLIILNCIRLFHAKFYNIVLILLDEVSQNTLRKQAKSCQSWIEIFFYGKCQFYQAECSTPFTNDFYFLFFPP